MAGALGACLINVALIGQLDHDLQLLHLHVQGVIVLAEENLNRKWETDVNIPKASLYVYTRSGATLAPLMAVMPRMCQLVDGIVQLQAKHKIRQPQSRLQQHKLCEGWC